MEIQTEEIILKNKKIILSAMFEIQVYEDLLTEAMNNLAKPDLSEKEYSIAEKRAEAMDKKLDAAKLKLTVAEKTIELA